MARKLIQAPSKYVQGKGLIGSIPDFVCGFGKKALIIGSPTCLKLFGDDIKKSFEDAKMDLIVETFGGECSKVEAAKHQKTVKENKIDIVIGVGGGKTLDTAKAVAQYEGKPVAIVPSIASTDAPCSALTVFYTEDGVFDEYFVLPKNPEVVIIDLDVVVGAPARLLVSGMGDALATYFEAQACYDALKPTMSGCLTTESALALAKLCLEILLKDGYKAKLACENKAVTKAVENVIEANTYLSGVGFESGGLAAAHAIHNGFTVMSECHHLYHGEKVAFGTICQLIMENRPLEEIETIIDFCSSVGLPTCLKDMGVKKVDPAKIMEVAEMATVEGETIHNMPFPVTAEDVFAAIMTADALGSEI
jgi:glycerol dehydrogenase